MHQNRVYRADGHKLVSFHPSARVQQQHHEAFAFRVEIRILSHMQPPVFGGLVWRLTNPHGFRHRTIPQGNHLEFLWVERIHTATSVDSMMLLPRMKSAAFCASAAA